jgi:hypothetical protein
MKDRLKTMPLITAAALIGALTAADLPDAAKAEDARGGGVNYVQPPPPPPDPAVAKPSTVRHRHGVLAHRSSCSGGRYEKCTPQR